MLTVASRSGTWANSGENTNDSTVSPRVGLRRIWVRPRPIPPRPLPDAGLQEAAPVTQGSRKPTADELRNLYEVKRLTKSQIAGGLGIARTTLNRYFKKAAIKTRSHKGPDHNHWKGGRLVRRHGSRMYKVQWMPEHHKADSHGYVKEAVLTAESKLGRPLMSGEIVHHVNFDSMDDSPENIAVLSSHSAHRRAEASLHRLAKALIEKRVLYWNGEGYRMAST